MSAIGKVKALFRHVPVLEIAEIGGAAMLAGYATTRYRDKASLAGQPADLVGGLAALGVGTALAAWGKGRKWAPHLQRVGVGGLVAYGHTKLAGYGAMASGVKRLLVREEDVKKIQALLPGRTTVLGAIPPAPKGDLLTTAQLAEMARG